MASEENKSLMTALVKEPAIAIVETFKILKGFISLIVFYLIVMEFTLLIFGYSFNFKLLSKEQFGCRKKVKSCLNTYIYYGVNDGKDCGSHCMDSLLFTLEGFHENNYFTQKLDEFYEGKIFSKL